jgi:thymidylate synthase (FAD)
MKSIELYGDGIGKVELVDSVGTDLTIVNSARVSFGVHKEDLDDKDKKLIRYLIKHKHTSTLEHCFVTFRVKVPLFIRSQHHRHRTWSYNEISRRYTAEKLEFYEPKAFRTQHKNNRQASNENELIDPIVDYLDFENAFSDACKASDLMKSHHINSVKLYNNLMEAGVCREQARGVLPQNLYTEYYASANLSNVLKFIELRSHEGAQWEIQKVADAMLQILKNLYPETIAAYYEVKQAH